MSGELGSFSFDVAKRILDYLHENGRTKKTNLATGSGLNYNVCMRYVKMLQSLGWLDVAELVQINESGRETRRRLSNIEPSFGSDGGSGSGKIADVGEHDISTNSLARVLLVDDEPDVALTFESFLVAAGFNVLVHTDAIKALRQFAIMPFQFDLAIIDIKMPGLNGIKLYQIFNAINPGCRVIFVSSLDGARELANSLTGVKGADIIRKPIEEKAFIKIVKSKFASE